MEATKLSAVKYTAEQTEELVKSYASAKTSEDREEVIQQYVNKFERTKASIIAKLSSEQVYVSKVRGDKNGNEIIRKEELVTKIAKLLNVQEDQIGSLEKANKPVLKLLINKLTSVQESPAKEGVVTEAK